MKTIRNLIPFFLFLVLVCQEGTEAQYLMPNSVLGSGGGVMSSSNYRITGTLGQPVIGVANSPANNSYLGFWYLPSRITTGITGVEREAEKELPTEYRLEQNYPNPFNPSTTIQFSLPRSGFVTLKVFSILGEEVATLASEELPAGRYTTRWNANGLPSGVYFYRLQTGDFAETKKLVLVK
jgi:hypothetical protein